MLDQYNQLYHSMLQDCEQCRKKQLPIIKELECCFHICTHYWGILRERITKYEFSTVDDEIYFFKNAKPLFTSEIEYFGYVSFAELTKEKERSCYELQRFWNNESLRMVKFIKANSEFYEYYKNGKTDQDETFFTRKNNSLGSYFKTKSYELENIAATSHDYLVASILALEKYQTYLRTNKAHYFHNCD